MAQEEIRLRQGICFVLVRVKVSYKKFAMESLKLHILDACSDHLAFLLNFPYFHFGLNYANRPTSTMMISGLFAIDGYLNFCQVFYSKSSKVGCASIILALPTRKYSIPASHYLSMLFMREKIIASWLVFYLFSDLIIVCRRSNCVQRLYKALRLLLYDRQLAWEIIYTTVDDLAIDECDFSYSCLYYSTCDCHG